MEEYRLYDSIDYVYFSHKFSYRSEAKNPKRNDRSLKAVWGNHDLLLVLPKLDSSDAVLSFDDSMSKLPYSGKKSVKLQVLTLGSLSSDP